VQYALVDRVKYFRRENGKPKASGSDRRLVVINYYIIPSLQYDRDRKEGFGLREWARARTRVPRRLSEERLEINLKPEEGGFFPEKKSPHRKYTVYITVRCVSPGFGSGKRITQNRVACACGRRRARVMAEM